MVLKSPASLHPDIHASFKKKKNLIYDYFYLPFILNFFFLAWTLCAFSWESLRFISCKNWWGLEQSRSLILRGRAIYQSRSSMSESCLTMSIKSTGKKPSLGCSSSTIWKPHTSNTLHVTHDNTCYWMPISHPALNLDLCHSCVWKIACWQLLKVETPSKSAAIYNYGSCPRDDLVLSCLPRMDFIMYNTGSAPYTILVISHYHVITE